MSKNQKIVVFLVISFMVVMIVWMWITPAVRIAEATEFSGSGSVYSGASSSQSSDSSQPSSSQSASSQPASSSSSTDSEITGTYGNILGDIQESVKEFDKSLKPGEYADVKAPAWVIKLSNKSQEWAAKIAVSVQGIIFGVSGLWYLHCLMAIIFDSWFYFCSGSKWSFFGKHLYEVKAMAGITPRQPQQNSGYGNNYGGSYGNNNYGNNYGNNYNQQQYNQQQYNQPGANSQQGERPGIFRQIGIFTAKHVIFVALIFVLMIVVRQGLIEATILTILKTFLSAISGI